MRTELTLQILDDKEECIASTNVLFVGEPLKPIPIDGVSYKGVVFAREFDYSEVDENEPDAPFRITVDARRVG